MSDQIRQISAFGRSDQFAEQLSALMDGELADEQLRFLLRGVEVESDLVRRWSSYHVISATLRREVVVTPLRADFAAGVLDRLDAERAVSQVPASRRYAAVRWIGGGAIAAAVAVVALVVSEPGRERGASAADAAQGAMVAQGAPAIAPGIRQAYLPLRPDNPMQSPGFLMQASDETILQNLYAPDGSAAPRDYFSQGAQPYVLYANPRTRRMEPQAQLPEQGAAPQN